MPPHQVCRRYHHPVYTPPSIPPGTPSTVPSSLRKVPHSLLRRGCRANPECYRTDSYRHGCYRHGCYRQCTDTGVTVSVPTVVYMSLYRQWCIVPVPTVVYVPVPTVVYVPVPTVVYSPVPNSGPLSRPEQWASLPSRTSLIPSRTSLIPSRTSLILSHS